MPQTAVWAPNQIRSLMLLLLYSKMCMRERDKRKEHIVSPFVRLIFSEYYSPLIEYWWIYTAHTEYIVNEKKSNEGQPNGKRIFFLIRMKSTQPKGNQRPKDEYQFFDDLMLRHSFVTNVNCPTRRNYVIYRQYYVNTNWEYLFRAATRKMKSILIVVKSNNCSQLEQQKFIIEINNNKIDEQNNAFIHSFVQNTVWLRNIQYEQRTKHKPIVNSRTFFQRARNMIDILMPKNGDALRCFALGKWMFVILQLGSNESLKILRFFRFRAAIFGGVQCGASSLYCLWFLSIGWGIQRFIRSLLLFLKFFAN